MRNAIYRRFLLIATACLITGIVPSTPLSGAARASDHQVLIFDYHRFNTFRSDSMTVRLSVFKFQLQYMAEHGYHFIPLARYVAYKEGKAPPPPPRSVVITMDDGHESVYTEALPLVEKYRIPVTLFIYPSAISNARYAMTWQQLRALKATGLFDIQSHTYWHPNFKIEKRRLTTAQHIKYVAVHLRRSSDALARLLGAHVSMVAWRAGRSVPTLAHDAAQAGYGRALAVAGRQVDGSGHGRAHPRYLGAVR